MQSFILNWRTHDRSKLLHFCDISWNLFDLACAIIDLLNNNFQFHVKLLELHNFQGRICGFGIWVGGNLEQTRELILICMCLLRSIWAVKLHKD